MKTSTKLLYGSLLALGVFVVIATGSWHELFMRLGVAVSEIGRWAQANPVQAVIVAAYILLAILVGWLASVAGRVGTFAFFFVLTSAAWALPQIRGYFEMSNKGIFGMVATALALGTIAFFLRETKEGDWFSGGRQRA